MRLLLLSHYYAPEIGAPQRRWSALVRHLRRAEVQVAVLTPPPHYPHGFADNVSPEQMPGARALGEHAEIVHRVRFQRYDTSVNQRGLDQLVAAADSVRVALRRFSRHRPDVIVATVPGLPTAVAGMVLSRAWGVPLVLEMRDAWPDLLTARHEWDDGGGRGPGVAGSLRRQSWLPDASAGRSRPRGSGPRRLAAELVHRGLTALQRRAEAVVTTTDSFAGVLRARGVTPVHVIRNGAAPTPPVPPREGEGPLRILYLGTLGRAQGLSVAIDAVHRLHQAGVEVLLRIVGDGAERPALIERAAGAPVEFCDPVRPAAVREHYEWCDTVLVSLREWEPMRWTVPSKLYEAMGTGRHITAVLDGEAAEIVRTTGAGNLSPPGDPGALARLWGELARDRAALETGSKAALWLAENADSTRLGVRYHRLLDDVVRRASTTRQ